MDSKIGPTFSSELQAAGVSVEGYSWGADGVIEFRADVPQSVRDQVAAVLAAHNPTAPVQETTRIRAALMTPIARALIAQIARLRCVSAETVLEEAVADAMAISVASSPKP